MAILKIPESEYLVLSKLAQIEPSDFSALLTAIQDAGDSFIQVDFAEKLALKVPAVKQPDLEQILKTVTTLYAVTRRLKKTGEDLGNDLKDTIENQKPKSFPVEKALLLKERIQKLFELGKIIGLKSKAIDVMSSQDHVFCAVRLLSDIRPVFQESPDTISSAMVIHNLRIGYHHNGEHEEFTVAMNTEDVRKIKEVLDRAEKKAKTLKSFIENSKIPYFEDRE
jgi:hypothetical protein